MVAPAIREPDASPALSSLAAEYRAVWAHAAYRRFSPGERYAEEALAALSPPQGASFIDFGCGTGRATAEIGRRGFPVLGVDFADNCLDAGIDVPFLLADLATLPPLRAAFGYCCDVLEHLPEDEVEPVLAGIARSVARGAFFSIALGLDAFGPRLLGKPLHLCVKPVAWWRAALARHWPSVEIVSADGVTLKAVCRMDARAAVEVEALCNSTHAQLYRNIEINSARVEVPWLSSVGNAPHDGHAVMVGGGPSLAGLVDEIRRRGADGQTIFALNGAAQFLARHGIGVDYQVVIDARPDNVRFVEGRPARRYLLASQCDPSLFDALAGAPVTLFHWGMEGIQDHIPKGNGKPYAILAGSYVVGPIAISAACVLGFRKFHLYGYDSSDAPDGAAHAYPQAQTAAEEKRLEVSVAGRTFRTSFAMFKQAEAFPAFAAMLAEHGCLITVHGDGLLPTIAREMTQPIPQGE